MCPHGSWGQGCHKKCQCQNGFGCDHETGECQCGPGFIGEACNIQCPYGRYVIKPRRESRCVQINVLIAPDTRSFYIEIIQSGIKSNSTASKIP